MDTVVVKYGGFWRRVVAFLIDYHIVMSALCLALIPAAMLFPKQILVEMPYGLFESSRTVARNAPEDLKTQYPSLHLPAQFNVDEPKRSVRSEVIERTVFGRWTHYYVTTTWDDGTETKLIDPVSGQEMDLISYDDFIWFVLLIYWSLMESSPLMGSLGKLALGLVVVDQQHQKLNLVRALGRNVSKVLSCLTLMIGFMMAGWTSKKQALHDFIARTYVSLR